MSHEDPTGIRAAAAGAASRGEASLASVCHVAPESLDGIERLASDLARAGRDDLARTLLEGVVALDATRRAAWRALAEASLRLSDPAAALDAATQAYTLGAAAGTCDTAAALVAARATLSLERLHEARTWLRHALAAPGSPRATRRTLRALARRLGVA